MIYGYAGEPVGHSPCLWCNHHLPMDHLRRATEPAALHIWVSTSVEDSILHDRAANDVSASPCTKSQSPAQPSPEYVWYLDLQFIDKDAEGNPIQYYLQDQCINQELGQVNAWDDSDSISHPVTFCHGRRVFSTMSG